MEAVAEVLKTTMTVMKDQQKQQIEEQQEQREQQCEQFEQQLKVLKCVSRRRSEVDGHSSKPKIASLGLQSLTNDVDIDDYFITFERSMRFNEIEKDQWMRYLTPHLKGKALSQYSALGEDSD